jgi:hypothetical protein
VSCAAGGRPLGPGPWLLPPRGRRGSGVQAGPQGRRRRRCAAAWRPEGRPRTLRGTLLEAKYPAIVKLWESAWAEFVPFLRFDREIRTLICTANAIESLNARFRRSVKARGHFPAEQAALKHLYLVVISLDPTGRGRQRWSNRWKAALNAFDIT